MNRPVLRMTILLLGSTAVQAGDHDTGSSIDTDNLSNPHAGHMYSATIRIAGTDRFSADWDFHEGGKRKSTESLRYTRIR